MSPTEPTGHASTCPVLGVACASCVHWGCRTSDACLSRLLDQVDMTDEGPDRHVQHDPSFDEKVDDRR